MRFSSWFNRYFQTSAGKKVAGLTRSLWRRLELELLEKRELLNATNDHFIAQAYRDLLGREAESSGLAYWNARLDQGGSREQIALGFTRSQEYESTLVRGLYNTYLHRTGEQQGVDYWIRVLDSDRTLDQIAASFLGSAEY